MPPPSYELVWPGKTRRNLLAEPHGPVPQVSDVFDSAWVTGCSAEPNRSNSGTGWRNRLIEGDNLGVMAALLPEFAGKVDFIYLDPPFEAGRAFAARVAVGESGATLDLPAYRDIWADGTPTYLQHLYDRLPLVRELLSPTGSLVVHVNWRVSHLVRSLLDEVFGPGEREAAGRAGFRNEIIWGYGGGGAATGCYRRKHDSLFWYTRSNEWTFHPQFRPYTEKTRKRGLTAIKGPRYALREEGASLETWWTDPGVQKILSPTAAENLKYPTQKPESLLERLILGHTHEGDLVADFYCGSGTTPAVAERLGRRWLAVDEGALAVWTTWKRLVRLQSEYARLPSLPREMWPIDRCANGDRSRLRFRAKPVDGRVALRDVEWSGAQPLPTGVTAWDVVDGWAVDRQPSAGNPFAHRWSAFRAPRGGPLVRESVLLPGGCGSMEVQVTDLWGRQCRAAVDAP